MPEQPPPSPLSADAEAARLRALAPYQALAASGNQAFAQLAELTARLFGVPMAQLSLVGASEVTYPGSVGEPHLADCLSRADTICAVTVYRPDAPTVFPDLLTQPCPWLRPEAQAGLGFYAGYPLRTRGGQAIGSLCVLDRAPRGFGADEQALLQRLAGIAMCALDLALLAGPRQAPGAWAALESRVLLSLQRIETLLALARFAHPAQSPAALATRATLHRERLLIVQDIEYQLETSFVRLGRPPA